MKDCYILCQSKMLIKHETATGSQIDIFSTVCDISSHISVRNPNQLFTTHGAVLNISALMPYLNALHLEILTSHAPSLQVRPELTGLTFESKIEQGHYFELVQKYPIVKKALYLRRSVSLECLQFTTIIKILVIYVDTCRSLDIIYCFA